MEFIRIATWMTATSWWGDRYQRGTGPMFAIRLQTQTWWTPITIVRSRWVNQSKNVNNWAVVHAIVMGPALIDRTWKCACDTYILESWTLKKVVKQKVSYIKLHTFNTRISNEWSTQRECTIATWSYIYFCVWQFLFCSHVSASFCHRFWNS